MARPRVAIIGHMPADQTTISLPKSDAAAKRLVQLYNYTRVATDDGLLVDHVAWLKGQRGVAQSEPFTLWEMFLCSGLLLRSHLERNGYEVLLVNYIDTDNEAQAFADLRAFQPDIVALSTTFVLTQRHMAMLGTRLRRELPEAWIVAGGHHVYTTLLHMTPDKRGNYLSDCQIDGFVNDSQGEGTLLAICQSFPNKLAEVPNLIWRNAKGEVQVNQPVAERNDVNATPVDLSKVPEGSVVHIRTARSCSFKCAFCSYPTIAGPLALMELDMAMTMIRQARDRNVKALFFIDDTFNVPRERFEALLDRMIAEKIRIPWYSFLRCQYIDENLVRKMAASGCAGVFIGVESGSDKVLKNMKKGAIVSFYWNGLRWLRDNGITTVGSFIVGFPGETADTVAETREFIEKSGLDYYFIQPFYYLHHTPVHKRAEKFGLKGNGLFWSHNTMNAQEAFGHLNKLFLEIENAEFVNPDYTLWEIAYLRTKGMSDAEILRYRKTINGMTRAQMKNWGLSPSDPTSRTTSGELAPAQL